MPRLFFVSHTGRMSAGSSHSLKSLVKHLRVSYDICVLLPEDGELCSELAQNCIRYQIVGIRRKFIPSLWWRFITQKADLVYANNFSVQAYFALIAAKLAFKPFIWHIREIGVIKSKSVETPVLKRMKYSLRYADAIVANSKATAQAVDSNQINREIHVIYNGIEIDTYNPGGDELKKSIRESMGIPLNDLLVINVGRICEAKNQLQVVETAAQVLKEYGNITFCFFGDFRHLDYVDRIKHRAHQLNIEGNLRFAGYQPKMENYFLSADVLLHTARNEPQGRVLLEAMAAGIPVVAYDDGGVRESVIDHKTGFLIPFGDIPGLANALKLLLDDPDLRIQMGANGRALVEANFTAERTSQQVEHVINAVLQRRL